MKQELIDYLTGKRILLLGLGREGQSTLAFLQENLPNAELAIADDDPNLTLDPAQSAGFPARDYRAHLNEFDLVIKSPGVPVLDKLTPAEQSKITCQSELFLRFCPNPTVGVTGTKGKSTTASLIAHILRENRQDVALVGNIGVPCFELIDQLRVDTIVVSELSSHQLEFCRTSPHIAILLNLYEEHLDHYPDATAYYDAKKNIFRHQNPDDILIFGDLAGHCSDAELDVAPATTKIDLLSPDASLPQNIQTHLLGAHNLQNVHAAIHACRALDLDDENILAAIKSFRGLPHRLEYLGKFRNIHFYNDSIATAQEATIAAINALRASNHPVDTLILGGMDRGLDYRPLVDYLRQSAIRNILLLPDTHENFIRLFNEAPFSQKLIVCDDLASAVNQAFALTAEEHSCLLSPAAASYHAFKNFEDRGNQFRALVHQLGA